MKKSNKISLFILGKIQLKNVKSLFYFWERNTYLWNSLSLKKDPKESYYFLA